MPRWYDDADALIADPGVDAVYVATPPGSHAELALKVAAAGKPCYVEKPMARSAAECRVMNAAFDAAGVRSCSSPTTAGGCRDSSKAKAADRLRPARAGCRRSATTSPAASTADAVPRESRLADRRRPISGGGLVPRPRQPPARRGRRARSARCKTVAGDRRPHRPRHSRPAAVASRRGRRVHVRCSTPTDSSVRSAAWPTWNFANASSDRRFELNSSYSANRRHAPRSSCFAQRTDDGSPPPPATVESFDGADPDRTSSSP